MASAWSLPASGNWLGNDGSWSTFLVQAGKPPQWFEILPSIQSQNLWVPIGDECNRLQAGSNTCGSSRGAAPFQQRPSSGFQANMSATWETIGLYQQGLERHHGITGNGLNGFDHIGLSDVTLQHFPVTAYASPGFWIGQMGLFPRPLNFSETISSPSLLQILKDDGHIPSLAYGYQAGAPYHETKVPASLVLGGYDRSRASSPLIVDINADMSRALTVGLQDIVVTNTLNGTLSMINDERILAPIDSSIAELWLPRSVCDRFESAFGLEYHEASDRYALTDATRDQLQQMDPTLTFTIGTNTVMGGNTTVIQFPYASFNLQAGYPIFANTTNYFPIRRADNESQYSIGRVFLQEAYIGVDFETGHFNVSAARWDSLQPDLVTILPSNESSSTRASRGLSVAAIIGIAIGCVLVIALPTCWVVFKVIKKRRNERFRATSGEIANQNVHTRPGNNCTLDAELSEGEVFELSAKHGSSELWERDMVSELEIQERVHELPSMCAH